MAIPRPSAATVLLLALLLLAAFFGFWRLDRYPRTWFDEGSYLLAAGNLAHARAYAALSADGTPDYAPIIGVGPTVLGPTAAAIRLGGANLAAARITPALYLVAATVVVALVCRSLFGSRASVASIGILMVMPSLDWISAGREVLGETAAFMFLLLGGIVAVRGQTRVAAAGGGVLLGLAMITKGQYVIVLPVTIALVALIDRFDSRRRPLQWFGALLAGMGVIYAGWIAALLLLIGDGHVVENLRLLRQSSGGALIVFNPERMKAALWLLLGQGALFTPAASIGFTMWNWRRAVDDRRLALLALLVFQATWTAWFAFASIGWPRYAFAALATSAMCSGPLCVSGFDAAMRHWRQATAHRSLTQLAGRLAIIGAIAATSLVLAVREIGPIAVEGDRTPQQFADIVKRTVPHGASVAGWEPEIGFLAGVDLLYPPPGSLDRVVRSRWLGQPAPLHVGEPVATDFLIVGPFGRWVEAYDEAIASSHYVLVLRVGDYELFERTD